MYFDTNTDRWRILVKKESLYFNFYIARIPKPIFQFPTTRIPI